MKGFIFHGKLIKWHNFTASDTREDLSVLVVYVILRIKLFYIITKGEVKMAILPFTKEKQHFVCDRFFQGDIFSGKIFLLVG